MSRIRGMVSSYDPLQSGASRKHLRRHKLPIGEYEDRVLRSLSSSTKNVTMADLDEEGRYAILRGHESAKSPETVAAGIHLPSYDTSRWLHAPKEYKTPHLAKNVVESLKRQYGDVAEVTGHHTFKTDRSDEAVAEAVFPHFARRIEKTDPKRAYEHVKQMGFSRPSFEEMGISVLPSLPPGTRRA
jgi:hypothetical protein